MNKNMFILASAGLLILAPSATHLFGVDTTTTTTTTPTSDKSFSVTVTQQPATDAVSVVKSDEAIAQDVRDTFNKDISLSVVASDVTVKSDKGVVTLSGTALSDKAKTDIGAKAQGVPGVTKVVNDIVVTPTH